MASTNKTTNYELSQFIGTDKPAWLTDYNGDMAKIDRAIKDASDDASTAQTTAETAQSTAETASSSASDAISQAQTASTDASTALSTAQTASTNASSAVTTANQAKSTADGLATNVSTAQTTANRAEGKADVNATNITNLTSAVSTNTNNISALASKFQLTDIDTVAVSTVIPNISANNGSLTLAQNDDGSIFKFYGVMEYYNTSTYSFTKSTIPMGTSQDTQIYGIDTGLVLNSSPEGAYQVSPAGTFDCLVRNVTSKGYNWGLGSSFAVGANGHIYVNIGTSSTESLYDNDKYKVIFTPSIYFNSNFGDEFTPTPEETQE